jgi:hypothetical protein
MNCLLMQRNLTGRRKPATIGDYQNEKLRIRNTFSTLLRGDARDSLFDDDNVRGTT